MNKDNLMMLAVGVGAFFLWQRMEMQRELEFARMQAGYASKTLPPSTANGGSPATNNINWGDVAQGIGDAVKLGSDLFNQFFNPGK